MWAHTRPAEFLSCTLYDYSDMTDAEYAGLPSEALGAGCRQWTNTPGMEPATASALCRVAPNVSCAGDRLYYVDNVPCIKYARRLRCVQETRRGPQCAHAADSSRVPAARARGCARTGTAATAT